MSTDALKLEGCCTACNKPVFEVKARFASGPLSRAPSVVGKPEDNARRVTFLLSDGSTVALSFCEPCIEAALGDLVGLWRKCVATNAWHFINEAALHGDKAPRRTPEQSVTVMAGIYALADKFILGPIEVEDWKEIHGQRLGSST